MKYQHRDISEAWFVANAAADGDEQQQERRVFLPAYRCSFQLDMKMMADTSVAAFNTPSTGSFSPSSLSLMSSPPSTPSSSSSSMRRRSSPSIYSGHSISHGNAALCRTEDLIDPFEGVDLKWDNNSCFEGSSLSGDSLATASLQNSYRERPSSNRRYNHHLNRMECIWQPGSNPYAQLAFDSEHDELVTLLEICLIGPNHVTKRIRILDPEDCHRDNVQMKRSSPHTLGSSKRDLTAAGNRVNWTIPIGDDDDDNTHSTMCELEDSDFFANKSGNDTEQRPSHDDNDNYAYHHNNYDAEEAIWTSEEEWLGANTDDLLDLCLLHEAVQAETEYDTDSGSCVDSIKKMIVHVRTKLKVGGRNQHWDSDDDGNYKVLLDSACSN